MKIRHPVTPRHPVCTGVLQYIAVCCRVLQALQCVAVCGSVLQCVAVCCDVMCQHINRKYRHVLCEWEGRTNLTHTYTHTRTHMEAVLQRVAECCSERFLRISHTHTHVHTQRHTHGSDVAACCRVLQCTASCKSHTHTHTNANTLKRSTRFYCRSICWHIISATHCNTLQHTVACCNTGIGAHEVCCSVLQCVAVRGSVLQCVARCCSVLQCVAVWCSVLQCVAVCCSVLQCVAMCFSVLARKWSTCLYSRSIYFAPTILNSLYIFFFPLCHDKEGRSTHNNIFKYCLCKKCVEVCLNLVYVRK